MGFNGDRPPYIVLSQSPAAGTEVEPGSEVELVINEE
jgi:beta-lactam-binding protein with PASTA domain